ncbi:MAG: response regulator transcription factor [Microbacterium sp.]
MKPLTVVTIDDDSLVRSALRIYLDHAEGIEFVGEAASGAEGITLCAQLRPDVALVDIQMPIMNGITATSEIIQRSPRTKVLALTTFSSESHVTSMLRAGATGYLVKDTPPDEIAEAIRSAHEGHSTISPTVASRLVEAASSGRMQATSATDLTDREIEVVGYIARGMTNIEIAEQMGVAASTVKTYIERITQKWDVRDRVAVLIRAAQLGIVTLADTRRRR